MTQAEVPTDSGARGRAGWWPRVRLLISLALLAAVLSRIDPERALAVLAGARLDLLAVAVLFGLGGRFFAAVRWYILVRAMGTTVRYLDLVRLTFIGMFLQFLPAGSIALEAGRVYGLTRETDDLAGSVASVLAERIFGFFALVVLALTGLAFAPPGVPEVLADLAWLGFGVIALGAWAIMNEPFRRTLGRLLTRVKLEPVRVRLRKLYERLDRMRARPKLMVWSAVAALFNTTFRIVPAYLVAAALGVDISLVQIFVIVPIVTFAAQVPISAAGLGVREVGWVALLGLIGVPASEAIVLPLLLLLIVLLTSLPGGWFYARHGLDAPDADDRTAG